MAWQFKALAVLMTLALAPSEAKLKQDQKILFKECNGEEDSNIYGNNNFVAEDIHRECNISVSDYQGKVLLVVNVASFWGYTPQYYTLNALADKYKDEAFGILAFPCNQFGKQEPGANATEILNGMKYVRPGMQRGEPFVAKFPLTWKVEVNGDGAHPFFVHLKDVCPPPWEQFWSKSGLWWEPLNAKDIKWNFEKFLIDHTGTPIRRYHSNTDPLELIPDIDRLLGKTRSSSPKSLSF